MEQPTLTHFAEQELKTLHASEKNLIDAKQCGGSNHRTDSR